MNKEIKEIVKAIEANGFEVERRRKYLHVTNPRTERLLARLPPLPEGPLEEELRGGAAAKGHSVRIEEFTVRIETAMHVADDDETFERVADALDAVELLSPALLHGADGSVSVIANVSADTPTDASARAGELARKALAAAGVETTTLTIYVDRGTDDLTRVVLVGGALLVIGILVGRLARDNVRIPA